MKKFFLLALAGLCTHVATAQTIRRVNNTPGLNDPNVYATAQAAHDAAVDGDIIYLEPAGGVAGANYGALNVNRRVHIYGTGYFLDEGNPNVPFDKRLASINNVKFKYGSANSTITGVNHLGDMTISVNNITVSRCKISGISLQTDYQIIDGKSVEVSYGINCIVTHCFVPEIHGSNFLNTNKPTPGTGIVITNNIIYYGIHGLHNSVINYNTFGYSPNASYVGNSTFTNNIIDARSMSTGYSFFNASNTSGNSISNNICVGKTGLPSGNGNVNGADPLITFVVSNPFVLNPPQGDAAFKLAPNSPAKTVAAGGGEAGAFGGGSPYLLSGLPPIPIVTNYFNSGSGNVNTPLSVTISVGSNN